MVLNYMILINKLYPVFTAILDPFIGWFPVCDDIIQLFHLNQRDKRRLIELRMIREEELPPQPVQALPF